jgi:hypothetical protein
MTSKTFLSCLFALFFLAVGLDFAIRLQTESEIVRLIVNMAAVGTPLCLLLRTRLREVGLDTRLAFLGFIFAAGFALGMYIYFLEPDKNEWM